MKTETVKGFRDIEDATKRITVKRIIEDLFSVYGFQGVETPLIEYEEFVKAGNQNDEAVSDVFKLEDKGKRKLALRYEFTFQLKRLAKNKKLPFRRYQIGEVFRDEPISSNRWRGFTQCDADVIGSSVRDEAEVLKLCAEILGKLGIKFKISVNNRKLLNEILEEAGVKEKDKESVIREIDKIDKLDEKEIKANLKNYNAEKVLAVLKKPAKYFEKYNYYSDIKELQKWCSSFGVKVEFTPYLARGLSYYNGTVFEVKSDIKESICGGGSYMVNGMQATGISLGLDRLESLSKINLENNSVLIISLDQDKKAIALASNLRKEGIKVSIMYGKIGKALEYANSYGIANVIILGKDEVKSKKYKLKNMSSGKEKLVSEKDLIKELK